MIFVTVGHQMPFDRLVRAVDAWAGDRSAEVFAQIGQASYLPRHLEWARTLSQAEFARRVAEASAIVAHAGTGSIIAALEAGKPIVVMPRLARLRETRNDHQVATARRFEALGRVRVAEDERALPDQLDRIGTLRPAERIAQHAAPELIAELRRFIFAHADPMHTPAHAPSQEPTP